MPMTCAPGTCEGECCAGTGTSGNVFRPNHSTFPFPHNDWLMYVLYYDDRMLLCQIIESAVASLRGANARHPCVLEALEWVLPLDWDSLDKLRGKLVVLLDADPASRERMAKFQSDRIKELRSPCPLKASGFFEEVHEKVLPVWLQDEAWTTGDLLEAVRDAYLVA